MYITVPEMVQKRLCAWVYAQVCVWVWRKEGSKWGLNGNNKWIWVKLYGYSLYCFYSCHVSISLHYFQIKSLKIFKKNAKEFCQQTLSVHTSILNYFIDLLVKH